MTFQTKYFGQQVLGAMALMVVASVAAGCSMQVQPATAHHAAMGEEQGQYTSTEPTARPVEGFQPGPMISFPSPPVDEQVDLAPRPYPGAEGLGWLSGYSLRTITEALNNGGEGARKSWYDAEELYEMRIDSYQYVENSRYCKNVVIFRKPNNGYAQWDRHHVKFCRAKPNSPWKLMR